MSTSASTRTFPYALVDVFAERALEGNPLAIFTDARTLSDEEMQALARETNLAETTFVLPGDAAEERAHGVRVRIFTTQEELPFAGHPTLGTAAWLWQHHPPLAGAETVTLRLKGGPVTVRFEPRREGSIGVYGTMRQRDPEFGLVHAPEDVARATGMAIADLDLNLPIQTVSTGLPFAIVPVRTLEAIGQLQVPQALARAYLAGTDAKFFYFLAPAAEKSGANFHARMQFYNGEDPATGSASGCAISYLVQNGEVPSGEQIVLEQGVEIRRPSSIFVRANLTAGKVSEVFVGGRTISVASGRFLLG